MERVKQCFKDSTKCSDGYYPFNNNNNNNKKIVIYSMFTIG